MTQSNGVPLVVLLEAESTPHHHAETMSKAGFRVVSLVGPDAQVSEVLGHAPNVVAAELTDSSAAQIWEFVRSFRLQPPARFIPCIVYGQRLQAHDIETAARVGALWLQLEPADGGRLAAAARGLVAAARSERRPDA